MLTCLSDLIRVQQQTALVWHSPVNPSILLLSYISHHVSDNKITSDNCCDSLETLGSTDNWMVLRKKRISHSNITCNCSVSHVEDSLMPAGSAATLLMGSLCHYKNVVITGTFLFLY